MVFKFKDYKSENCISFGFKLESTETLTLGLNDKKLSKEIWDDIQQKNINDILKPKVVADKYASVKIISVKEPQVKSFEEAKEAVTALYEVDAKKKALSTLAESTLKTLDESNADISDFLSLQTRDNLKSLNLQESLQFI